MSGLNLSRLNQYKDEILKAEIGALLFNLGKTHAGINNWRNYFSGTTQLFSGYKDYYENGRFKDEIANINNKLKDFIFNQDVKFPGNLKIDWKEFFFGNASSEDFIQKVFFQGCENINSGIDKGSPKDENQLRSLWISNAFGSFKKNVEEKHFDEARLRFFNRLHRWLEENGFYTNPDWGKIRECIFAEIKSWYSCLLSDSRFPVNDVTLFDQAYMTASMFKAVMVAIYLNNSFLQTYQRTPQSIKWSILGIQYDKLGLAEKGLKIASIKWYRETTKRVDDAIKEIIEIRYTLGNEVYRDATGVYFVVPENIKGEKNGDFYKLHNDLEEIKENIIEIFSRHFEGEIYPAILLTEPSRGLMNLGHLVEKAKENFLMAEIPEEFSSKLKHDDNPNGICQICRMRLAHKGNKDDLTCDVCRKRQEGRMKAWLNDLGEETIWLSELQDKNRRVALVTLKFELEKWLNGDLLNSLIVNKSSFFKKIEDVKEAITNPEKQVLIFKEKLDNDRRHVVEKLYLFKHNLNSINVNNCKQSIIEQMQQIGERNNIGKILSILSQLSNSQDIDNLIELIKGFFDNLSNIVSTDIFDFVRSCHQAFNKNSFNNLKNEIENSGKLWNSVVKELSFIEKIMEEGVDFSCCGINNGKFIDLLELLQTTVEKIKTFVKKQDKDVLYFKENVIKKLYPFKYIPDLLNYFYKTYYNIDDFHNRLIFDSVTGYTEWEKLLDDNWITIDNNKKRIKWQELGLNELNNLTELVAQLLLRKNPSPARLRRIWENTREFFEEIEKDIVKIAGIPDDRCIRLYWDNINLKDGEYWSGDFEFWVLDGKAFLITHDSSIIEKYRNGDDFEFKLKNSSFSLHLKDAKEETYKSYMSIIDPTPVSWQFIIPAEYVPNVIDNVLERYNRNFKYVYGKLPLHIGIVIQDYKRPLYVGINALRRIRRDVKDTEKLWISEDAGRFCIKQKRKISPATPEELCNRTEDYYSLYWENSNNKGYLFYIKPEDGWKKWVSTLDKFSSNDKVEYIPNTFDFEFLDTNTRRNDIYYASDRNYKRANELKANQPYELEDYWEKFKIFRKIFSDKTSSSKLHNLVSLLYSKLEDFSEAYSYLLSSAFINILELKKNEELRNGVFKIFEVQSFKELIEKLKRKESILLFLDMFEFWHTALKEV